MLSEVGCQLAEVGREDLLFEITNLEMQLHELHLNLMKPAIKAPAAAPQKQRVQPVRAPGLKHAL
jgi:hypothetical protein